MGHRVPRTDDAGDRYRQSAVSVPRKRQIQLDLLARPFRAPRRKTGPWLALSGGVRRVALSREVIVMSRTFASRRLAAAVITVSVASAVPAAAVNLFSTQQDIQMGRQAATQA